MISGADSGDISNCGYKKTPKVIETLGAYHRRIDRFEYVPSAGISQFRFQGSISHGYTLNRQHRSPHMFVMKFIIFVPHPSCHTPEKSSRAHGHSLFARNGVIAVEPLHRPFMDPISDGEDLVQEIADSRRMNSSLDSVLDGEAGENRIDGAAIVQQRRDALLQG